MRRFLMCVALLFGCGEHGSSPPAPDAPADMALSSANELTSFRFLAADNPALLGDVTATITGTDIVGNARFALTLADLKATFTTTGASVTVAGQPQTSGLTPNTFGAMPVLYTVTAEDGSTRRYTVRIAAPSFRPKVDFAAGTTTVSAVAADFNGDGKPDLAVTSRAPAVVVILLNTTVPGATTPTFARTDLAAGSTPGYLAIGDVNGDGKPDVALATTATNSVSVFVNTTASGATTPTFAARRDFPAGTTSFAVAFADFNADGKPDLAVGNGGGNNSVSILLNTTATGSTTASFAANVDIPTGPTPYSIAAGDLNGDSRPDLVVAHVGGFRPIVALINTTQPGAATPTFAANLELLSGENTESARLGDVNADGKPDLVIANNSGGALVRLNTTAAGTTPPTFASALLFATGGVPLGVGFADIDGDGAIDLVAANSTSTVGLLLGTTPSGAAMPTFRTKREYATSSGPDSIAIADYNQDGKPDVAVATYTAGSVSVLLAE